MHRLFTQLMVLALCSGAVFFLHGCGDYAARYETTRGERNGPPGSQDVYRTKSLERELEGLKRRTAEMEASEMTPKVPVQTMPTPPAYQGRRRPIVIGGDVDTEIWVIGRDERAGEGRWPHRSGGNSGRIVQPRTGLPSERGIHGYYRKGEDEWRPDLPPACGCWWRKEPVCPVLVAYVPQRKVEVPLPLKHTDVKARVEAFLATVHVTQQYENPYNTKIEAKYMFPLPQDAAVTDFLMIIGCRRIRGVIREREEAQRIYQEARRQGYRASLLIQERPNIFTQKVANIEPGHAIDVQITYFNTLHYRDGEFEFVFPTVVGPRFNPPGSREGIGATSRGSGGASSQEKAVEYLWPDERSGHDIALQLDIDAGVPIRQIQSPTHAVELERRGEGRARVCLSSLDRIPNKDFVLRFRTAHTQLQTALFTQRARDGHYFTLLLQPPEALGALPRMPREMVFVLDCSGSMAGEPLEKAKAAARRCLQNLSEYDTFQIIRFSDNARAFRSRPVAATRHNLERGLHYLDALASYGGTMMVKGLRSALDFPEDETRLRIITFMTDGYIGNEAEVLRIVKEEVGTSRIFSFGVGSSVNRYLMERMAKLGRGAVAYVGLDDGVADSVDRFYERASRPALANIHVDWNGAAVSDVYPRHIPDLFVGRPILITGKFRHLPPEGIRIRGRVGNEWKVCEVHARAEEPEAPYQCLRTLWARRRIAELADQAVGQASWRVRRQITRTSMDYGVLCQYTAFLAVDSLVRTRGTHGVSVNVPVPVPEGVPYETSVGGR